MNLHQLFDDYLHQNGFSKLAPSELYEPIDYVLTLGGKRIRPVLTLMACQLFSDDVKPALPAAYAIELFHNFSLVHDDIMDKSPLRRGKPSVHTKYDTNTAILSGDVTLVYAYHYLNQVDPSILPSALAIFNEVAIGVCEGQQLDVNFETKTDVSISNYIRMIELKTSVLIDGAMRIGALVGGASAENAKLLGNFGRNMGIAFQMQDDFLDTFGKQASVGKRIGGDIVQNKKTYLVLKSLELADAKTKAELLEWLSSSPPTLEEENIKIQRVTEIFTHLGIPNEMKSIIQIYHNKAVENLQELPVANEKKKGLFEFLEILLHREH